MSWFVHYSEERNYDHYYGFQKFASKEEALKYIEDQMKLVVNPNLSAFTLIEGVGLTLVTVEYITRIKLKVGPPQ